MIGIDYLNRLYQILKENTGSQWIDKKTSFDFIYEAAKDMAKETKSLHSTQTITTVANQSAYDLNPGFLNILATDGYGNNAIKYSDGTYTRWLTQKSYDEVLYANNTTSVTYPQNFAIADHANLTRITGSATASGSASGGESTLTDAAATFTSLKAGDAIYNTTQSYIGVVLSVTDSTHIVTAMFDHETTASPYASWTSGDAYIIQPAERYQIIIDPPPSTSGHTATVTYYCTPDPVYSDYGAYPFPSGYNEALLKYAVWLYEYRDKQPDFGNALYVAYDVQIRKANNVNNLATGKKKFSVSFITR